MRQLNYSSLMGLSLVLAATLTGCGQSTEGSNEELGVTTLFSCPSLPGHYRDFMQIRQDYTLRDELEQMARSHFDESCLADCELTGDMIACTTGSCPSLDGGTVTYDSYTTWETYGDPDEGTEFTRLTITIDNPPGAELQHFELVAETSYTAGFENDNDSLDLTVSWVGSLSDDFPVDSAMNYSYTGRTFDGCFSGQHITSETEGCRFEVHVAADDSLYCDNPCNYTVTLENGDELLVTDDCPPFRQ